jgi:hypothetical protein
MDGWMKALFGAACIVVIAAGAYYAWGEYGKNQKREEVEQARQRIFNQAGASPGEVDKVRRFCKGIVELRGTTLKGNAFADEYAHNCRVFGYLY